jgi:FkbM family methyltransferase
MTEMEYAGVTLDIAADLLTEDVRRALEEGSYEREETECVDLYVQPDDDVVELGGGIGYLACYVDRQLSGDGTHLVVEPNGHLLPLLERHRVLNDARFEVLNAAYSTVGPVAELSIPESFWEASLQRPDRAERTLYAGTVTLADIFGSFDLTDVALVVDIEGGEVDLIENELDVIENHCRLVVVEYHYRNAPLDLATDVRWAKGALDESAFELVDEKDTVSVYRSPEG